MDKEDGGSAFPLPFVHDQDRGIYVDCDDAGVSKGLSVRDYFAAKAMNGMFQGWPNDADAAEIARRSYVLADAMIEARGRSI